MGDARKAGWKTIAVPALLLVSAFLALLWEVSSRYSARPFSPFTLDASRFAGFDPAIPGWTVKAVQVPTNRPEEPNILAFEVVRGGRCALVRLVHGYNMPMCMKIKEYDVALVSDRRVSASTRISAQVWRVTSSIGDSSIWITSLLRAGDCAVTEDDIRSLPFPRIGTPDDPRWKPEGLTWKSLRHPVSELRARVRARWNSSRADVLTFLRLRQPAWASEELLTLVSCALPPPDGQDNGEDWSAELMEIHAGFARSLRQWKEAAGEVRGAP